MTYRTRRRPGHLGIRLAARHHWRPTRPVGPGRTPLRLGPAPIRTRSEIRGDVVGAAIVLAIVAAAVALIVVQVTLWVPR